MCHINDRDLSESKLQIEIFRHVEDRVSSMPALCNAKCWTCASVKCVISSLLDNEVASTLAIYLISSRVTRRGS